MFKNNSFFAALCGLCIGLFTVACSSDDFADENATVSNTTKAEKLDLISVPVSVGQQAAPTTRAMMRDDDGYIMYNFTEMAKATDKPYDIVLCLRLREAKTVAGKSYDAGTLTYSQLKTNIAAKSDNSGFTFSLPDAEAKIIEGTSLADYDACAVLNTGIDSETFLEAFLPKDQNTVNPTATTVDFSSLPYTDEEHSVEGMAIPMYSSYADSKIDGSSISLHFKMMGTVVNVSGNVNPLAQTIRVNKVMLNESNVKSGSASFILGKETDATGTAEPAFTFTDTTKGICTFDLPDTGYDIAPDFDGATVTNADGTTVQAGNTTLSADFWCMPISSADCDKGKYGIDYSTTDYTKSDDVINRVLDKNIVSGGLKTNTVYKVPMSLPESDLMITEMDQLAYKTYNYSMVEIYNPTNRVIDLRDYGLVRQMKLYTTKQKATYVCFNDELEDINEARVQDLWIDGKESGGDDVYEGTRNVQMVSGKTPADQKSYVNSYYNVNRQAGAEYVSRYTGTSTYSTTIGDKKYTWTLQSYELAPGQSICLFGGGTWWQLVGGHNETRYPNGKKAFNSDYLYEAIRSGECKYALAVDNGAYNATGDYWTEDAGGVMQLGHDQNLLLMKKNTDGSFAMLDAGFSLDPKNYTYSDWVRNKVATWQSTVGWAMPRYAVRDAAIMYPFTIRPANDMLLTSSYQQKFANVIGTSSEGRAFDWRWRNTTGDSEQDPPLNVNAYPVSPGTKYKKAAYM